MFADIRQTQGGKGLTFLQDRLASSWKITVRKSDLLRCHPYTVCF